MAYVISDVCICCGTCEDECQLCAIFPGDGIYVINAEMCIRCGICADACPVAAIEEK